MLMDVTGAVSAEGVTKGVLYALVGLFVIFINSMVIASFVIRGKSKRGIPDIFIFNFAVSSILTCVTVVFIVAYVRTINHKLNVGSFECSVQCFFGTLLRLTDVATTTGVAVDRFVAVYKPIFYRTSVKLKHGYMVCGAVWLACIILSLLPFVGLGGINNELVSICTANWHSSYAVVIFSVTYAQLVVVLICYVGIFNCIKGLIGRKKAMIQSQNACHLARYAKRNASVQINVSIAELPSNRSSFGDDDSAIDDEVFVEETVSEQIVAQEWRGCLQRIRTVVYEAFHLKKPASQEKSEPRSIDLGREIDEVQGNSDMLRPRAGLALKRFSTAVSDKWKNRGKKSASRFYKDSKHFAKVMGIIVAIFYISWLPLAVCINGVWADVWSEGSERSALWLGYNISMLSSGAIPIAYAVMCKPYRIGYKHLGKYLKKLCSRK